MQSQGLLADLRTAAEHPRVAVLGALLGGFPPAAAYLLTHHALPQLWHSTSQADRVLFYALLPVVAACLAFSVTTVWHWGARAFRDRFKASCLVVALEGVMVLSPLQPLSAVALAYLVLVNAIATACTLVAEDKTEEAAATPAPSPTVEDVARELGLTRRGAAKVVDRRQKLQREQPA